MRIIQITGDRVRTVATAEEIAIMGGENKCGIVMVPQGGTGYFTVEIDRDEIPDLIAGLQAAYDYCKPSPQNHPLPIKGVN